MLLTGRSCFSWASALERMLKSLMFDLELKGSRVAAFSPRNWPPVSPTDVDLALNLELWSSGSIEVSRSESDLEYMVANTEMVSNKHVLFLNYQTSFFFESKPQSANLI